MNLKKLKSEDRCLEKLILFGTNPMQKDISKFLDKLFWYIDGTNSLKDFEIALKLFRKWETNLLRFYSIVNSKIIDKIPSDFERSISPVFRDSEFETELGESIKEYKENMKRNSESIFKIGIGSEAEIENSELSKQQRNNEISDSSFQLSEPDFGKGKSLRFPMDYFKEQ